LASAACATLHDSRVCKPSARATRRLVRFCACLGIVKSPCAPPKALEIEVSIKRTEFTMVPPKALVFGACLECIESACVTLFSVSALEHGTHGAGRTDDILRAQSSTMKQSLSCYDLAPAAQHRRSSVQRQFCKPTRGFLHSLRLRSVDSVRSSPTTCGDDERSSRRTLETTSHCRSVATWLPSRRL